MEILRFDMQQKSQAKNLVIIAMVLLFSLMYCHPALAAISTGAEFEDLYNLVNAWATGFLGKTIAVCFLLVGLGLGILKGSIIATVTCLAAAVSLLMAPGIIDSMFKVTGG